MKDAKWHINDAIEHTSEAKALLGDSIRDMQIALKLLEKPEPPTPGAVFIGDTLVKDLRNFIVAVEHRSGLSVSYYTSDLDAAKDFHIKVGQYQKSADFGMGKAHIMLLEIKKHEVIE